MAYPGFWRVFGALALLLAAAPALAAPHAAGGVAGPPSPFSRAAGQGGDAAWREADRARRELQRQQRIAECQNRVLARQGSYASQADFLRARQACAGTR